MLANKFLLKHDELEVEYTIGLNPGLGHFQLDPVPA